jgi:23S rRNA pseudouridine1911/1915/1917 synthase
MEFPETRGFPETRQLPETMQFLETIQFPAEPRVLAETRSFLVVYKPPRMHSAPLKDFGGDTLLEWCAGFYPEVRIPQGRLLREGGLFHRLDYETRGLVLLARTQDGLISLDKQQKRGSLIKEYGALTVSHSPPLPLGFPPPPKGVSLPEGVPVSITSAFRPYGPGQQTVRPVIISGGSWERPKQEVALDRGAPYGTKILEIRHRRMPAEFGRPGEVLYFRLSIVRGFRHQIRCHLAWLGYPILNDRLYGGLPPADTSDTVCSEALGSAGPPLALKAQGLFFRDPVSGENRSYTLPPFGED